jgi:hypothetical protein
LLASFTTLRRLVRPERRVDERSSDALVVRRCAPPLSRRREDDGPDSLPPVARQCDRSSRIRAPFIDECSPAGAFARAVWMRARHRSRGFAASDPASGTSSRLPRSRAEELDLLELSASSSLTGSRGHAPLVDFCNRYDPRARPRSSELRRTAARSPVTQHFSRAWLPCDIGLELRMAGLATARFPAPPGQNHSQPRFVGPGAGVDDDRLAPAPPAAIARAGALPQPVTCLGHLVSLVRGAVLDGVEVHQRLMGRLFRTSLAFGHCRGRRPLGSA